MMIANHIKFTGQVFLHLAQSTLQIVVHLLSILFVDSVVNIDYLISRVKMSDETDLLVDNLEGGLVVLDGLGVISEDGKLSTNIRGMKLEGIGRCYLPCNFDDFRKLSIIRHNLLIAIE